MNIDPGAVPGLDENGQPIRRRIIIPHGASHWGWALDPRLVVAGSWGLSGVYLGYLGEAAAWCIAALAVALRAAIFLAVLPVVPLLRRHGLRRGIREGWVLVAPEPGSSARAPLRSLLRLDRPRGIGLHRIRKSPAAGGPAGGTGG